VLINAAAWRHQYRTQVMECCILARKLKA